jgi:hypothetical protein
MSFPKRKITRTQWRMCCWIWSRLVNQCRPSRTLTTSFGWIASFLIHALFFCQKGTGLIRSLFKCELEAMLRICLNLNYLSYFLLIIYFFRFGFHFNFHYLLFLTACCKRLTFYPAMLIDKETLRQLKNCYF